MAIYLRISIVHMMFIQITRGTKDHTLRFGNINNIKGEFTSYQPSLKPFRSELTAQFFSVIDFDENEILLSSAYIVTFPLCNVQGKSFMYIKNSIGPRHDPCAVHDCYF